MKGVILFADDHIFDSERLENKLFQKFNKEGNFSILPINNLNILEKTVSSISTYKALILDWNFEKDNDDDDDLGFSLPDENPFEFLKANKIYSLIYVYSQSTIGAETKAELEKLYPGKIFFESKNATNDPVTEYEKITKGINDFENANKHLVVPFIWFQTINKSAQNIFRELESADPNWIKEIYKTSKDEGGEPNSEVIGVFHNLLNEAVIQNEFLITALRESFELPEIAVSNKEISLAKLYNRIYYTKLIDTAPIMTGDIFRFDDDTYAILITPECDVNKRKGISLEFLSFTKSQSVKFISKKKNDLGIYNNGVQSRHILPSFPFEVDTFNVSACIDFDTSFIVKPASEFIDMRSSYKLNSPYIYQLRQRYMNYLGRVGVPTIPDSLRQFNMK